MNRETLAKFETNFQKTQSSSVFLKLIVKYCFVPSFNRSNKSLMVELGGIANYKVLSKIAEGAYGIVLKCVHRGTNETVAIKKFKQSSDDELVKKTSMREVQILNALKDRKNVVLLKEAFQRKGRLCLVLEYMEMNLLQIIEKNDTGIDADLLCVLIYQLVKAIAWCHKRNIVHRDIKPENLLVNPGKTADEHVLKLCDFGFARVLPRSDNGGRMNDMTDYVATRWYRAPELLLGSNHYGKEVDLWAIACIMGELIDGQPLFPGESELDQLYIIQKALGHLTIEQMEAFKTNPRFMGETLRDVIMRKKFIVGGEESIDYRYLGKVSKHALSFMKLILQLDPNNRPTCSELLNHPYFDHVRANDKDISELLSTASPEVTRKHAHGHKKRRHTSATKSQFDPHTEILNSASTKSRSICDSSIGNSRAKSNIQDEKQPVKNDWETAMQIELDSKIEWSLHQQKRQHDKMTRKKLVTETRNATARLEQTTSEQQVKTNNLRYKYHTKKEQKSQEDSTHSLSPPYSVISSQSHQTHGQKQQTNGHYDFGHSHYSKQKTKKSNRRSRKARDDDDLSHVKENLPTLNYISSVPHTESIYPHSIHRNSLLRGKNTTVSPGYYQSDIKTRNHNRISGYSNDMFELATGGRHPAKFQLNMQTGSQSKSKKRSKASVYASRSHIQNSHMEMLHQYQWRSKF